MHRPISGPVYYIPNLTINLTSVGKIYDSGCDVKFSVTECSIYDWKTHEVVRTCHGQGDLYVLDHFRDIHDTASSNVNLSSFWLNRLPFLASTRVLEKLDAHDISNCSGCKLEKFLALPFSNTISYYTVPFDIVHSDVRGPSPASTKGGSKNIDDVDKTMDEINDQAEKQMQDALATPLGLAADFD
ncbi:hypothetical protein Tco_0741888 [Tanacetum coccineum]